MPVGFTKMYAERLNRLCQMEVREAVNGDEIRPGLALVAPADYQAKVVRMGPRYTLSCIPGEKVSGHRPSVDVLFSSMAASVRCRMVGIIMTGMGRDGASGLLEMRKAGAYTIGQDITVLSVDSGGNVSLGIQAPKEMLILRSELQQAVSSNQEAAQSPSTPQLLASLESAFRRAEAVTPPSGPHR